MSRYISSAKHIFDENLSSLIEITYSFYDKENDKYQTDVDTIFGNPRGNWKNITFSVNDFMLYQTFLKTLVHNTVYVCRKIASLQLDYVLANSYNKHIKLMNMINILDPTFHPPKINTKCRWQRSLMWELADKQSHEIIRNCFNVKRLNFYIKELESIVP